MWVASDITNCTTEKNFFFLFWLVASQCGEKKDLQFRHCPKSLSPCGLKFDKTESVTIPLSLCDSGATALSRRALVTKSHFFEDLLTDDKGEVI